MRFTEKMTLPLLHFQISNSIEHHALVQNHLFKVFLILRTMIGPLHVCCLLLQEHQIQFVGNIKENKAQILERSDTLTFYSNHFWITKLKFLKK